MQLKREAAARGQTVQYVVNALLKQDSFSDEEVEELEEIEAEVKCLIDFGLDLPNTSSFLVNAADWAGEYFYVGIPLLGGVMLAHAWSFRALLERADNNVSLKTLAALILFIPVGLFLFCLICLFLLSLLLLLFSI